MSQLSLRGLLGAVRELRGGLSQGLDDPHTEFLAMVWGPKFDRQHGLALVAARSDSHQGLLAALTVVADHFDQLSRAQQARVRRMILRQRQGVTIPYVANIAH